MNPTVANLLFFGACIPLRLLMVYIASIIPAKLSLYYAILLFVIGVSFVYLYVSGSRMNAMESSTGKTWWSQYRIIHGIMYLGASIAMYNNMGKIAMTLLIMDVVVGLIGKMMNLFISS